MSTVFYEGSRPPVHVYNCKEYTVNYTLITSNLKNTLKNI